MFYITLNKTGQSIKKVNVPHCCQLASINSDKMSKFTTSRHQGYKTENMLTASYFFIRYPALEKRISFEYIHTNQTRANDVISPDM
jgi:hypothetical protein